MQEAAWLACKDPEAMLEAVRHKASERKLRLFACACTRESHRRLPARDTAAVLRLVEAQERVAERLRGRGGGRRRQSSARWLMVLRLSLAPSPRRWDAGVPCAAQAKRLWAKGMTLADLGAVVGVSKQRVYQVLFPAGEAAAELATPDKEPPVGTRKGKG